VSVQTVGVVLVSGMLIIPPSTALLLSTRIPTVLLFSALIGVCSAVIGSYISFLFSGIATGPAMVLICGGLFAVAFIAGPYGLLREALYGNGGWEDSSG
jgi:ABC-type Mn2+/Zn2+ transport system permease subunit